MAGFSRLRSELHLGLELTYDRSDLPWPVWAVIAHGGFLLSGDSDGEYVWLKKTL